MCLVYKTQPSSPTPPWKGHGTGIPLTVTQPGVEKSQIVLRQSLIMYLKLASDSLNTTSNIRSSWLYHPSARHTGVSVPLVYMVLVLEARVSCVRCTYSTPQSKAQVLVLLGNMSRVFTPALNPSFYMSLRSLHTATRCGFLPSRSCLGRRKTPTPLSALPCFSLVLPGLAGRLTGAPVVLGCWEATLNPPTRGRSQHTSRRRGRPSRKGLGCG